MMTVERFFDCFLTELKENRELWAYYKFLSNGKRFAFRKAYFCQRLQYVKDHIGSPDQLIWDCGCGYGTTSIFLALNGYSVFGSTLEFYYREIGNRKEYWSQYGDLSRFDYVYEDLFSTDYKDRFHTVLVQDTLHHLEPVEDALGILNRSLKSGGRLLVIEENGRNIVQNLKLWKQRGNKRKAQAYDEVLQKHISFGNENIRSLKKWEFLLKQNSFLLDRSSLQHIRFFPPQFFQKDNYPSLIEKEQRMAQYPMLAKYFYFGINFIANKSE